MTRKRDSGKYRHLISIQDLTNVAETRGGGVGKTYATTTNTYAEVKPIQGTEIVVADQFKNIATHIVTFRYVENLTVDKRILFGTRTFNILHFVDEDERNIEQKCIVKEES